MSDPCVKVRSRMNDEISGINFETELKKNGEKEKIKYKMIDFEEQICGQIVGNIIVLLFMSIVLLLSN